MRSKRIYAMPLWERAVWLGIALVLILGVLFFAYVMLLSFAVK